MTTPLPAGPGRSAASRPEWCRRRTCPGVVVRGLRRGEPGGGDAPSQTGMSPKLEMRWDCGLDPPARPAERAGGAGARGVLGGSSSRTPKVRGRVQV